MRLPERAQNRWVYAAVAGVTALLFAVAFFAALVSFEGSFFEVLKGSVYALGAFPAAYLCWPSKTRRTAMRMVLAGVASVFVAFIIVSVIIAIAMVFMADGSKIEAIQSGIGILILVPLFGSVLTLGLPYLIGVALSLLFREAPRQSVDKA